MTKDEFLERARSLPNDQRIDLAMDLWETIDPDGLAVTPAQRDELGRRLAADDADTNPAEEWEDLKAKLVRAEF